MLVHLSTDVAVAMAGEGARSEDIEFIRTQYGFDRPLAVQYADWLGRASRGDFGESLYFRTPVAGIVSERLPTTLLLGALAIVIALAALDPARGAGGDAPEHVDRPADAHDRGRRPGDAVVLVRARPDPRLRPPSCLAADFRQRNARALRPARDRARLLRRAGDHAAHAVGDARGARLGLRPHRAREGAPAARGAVQARAPQRDHPGRRARRGAARLHARRFGRDRDRVRA